ncbi:MAG: RdgB/HAM1 family non-canonical purine NTP pyrophosphatase [Bacteroidales bacterium]|nr:RdgB/HAM1 family non-canonical purine NTP pyrophosphatase [Bacteroidales bacterium]
MKIVFATGNIHKLREAQEILGPGFELVRPEDIGLSSDIPETGSTLEENSLQKASCIFGQCGLACFADDTGLEVDALGGEPGVYTARYAYLAALEEGRDVTEAEYTHNFDANMDLLLKKLSGISDRTARFRSVVTLILADGSTHVFPGTMEGRIAGSKAGCGGFGYDPVFIADDYSDRTVAELPEETKNEISHRGKALRSMAAWLKDNNG